MLENSEKAAKDRRTPHGVRGLKCRAYRRYIPDVWSRTPHGVRGLKSKRNHLAQLLDRQSHPARGAWIEINYPSPHRSSTDGRTPHGVRGLKWCYLPHTAHGHRSHPARGAWIEIIPAPTRHPTTKGRTPHGVRGLKYGPVNECINRRTSHPARGAWIEISAGLQ